MGNYRKRGMPLDDVVRHFRDTARVDENGCRISSLGSKTNGYVRFSLQRQKTITRYFLHREVLRLKLGRPIRDGYETSHLCHNRACCNEDHLVEETHKENAGRSLADDRYQRGEQSGVAKLTEGVVREIRRRFASGESRPDISEAMGISYFTLYDVIARKTWKHIHEVS